jgi:hypothetical protein
MTTKYSKTAQEAYKKNRARIAAAMAELELMIEEMDADQARKPSDWGHAGSAGGLASHIEQLAVTK